MPWGTWQKRPRCDVTCDGKGFGADVYGKRLGCGREAIAEPVLHWHCGILADMIDALAFDSLVVSDYIYLRSLFDSGSSGGHEMGPACWVSNE